MASSQCFWVPGLGFSTTGKHAIFVVVFFHLVWQGDTGTSDRTIALVDANAFFASCAALEDPKLHGRPVVVAGDPGQRHGVILSVSYEAKRLARGPVHAGMPLGKARRLLPPDVVVAAPDHALYQRISDQMYDILQRFSPLVVPASIDEAFLDWTGSLGPLGHDPVQVAIRLKQAIRTEIGLTVSVGIGWSQVSAKMAAELQKPDGLTILDRDGWSARVYPLAVGELWGVGPKTVPKLHALGIRHVGDLAAADLSVLQTELGEYGRHIWAAAHGDDTEPIDARLDRQAKSLSHATTLAHDVSDRAEQKAVLLGLCDAVAGRLRENGYLARTVGIRIRTPAFRNFTHAKTLPVPTDTTDEIYRAACELLDRHLPAGRAVRLLGVELGGLIAESDWQQQLLDFDASGAAVRRRQVDRVVDEIRARFGKHALVRGSQLYGKFKFMP